MKKNISVLLLAAIPVSFSSCAKSFYQIHTVSSNDVAKHENVLQYEDDDCIITYDLWSENGDIGFLFYNKTDENIYIDLSKTFFIKNGVAYDYFRNRVYSTSSSIGATMGASATVGRTPSSLIYGNKYDEGVAYEEQAIICIPSHSAKIISEYQISSERHVECGFLIAPHKNEKSTRLYPTAEKSPLTFENRITYKIGNSNEEMQIQNDFYVSEITNVSAKAEEVRGRYVGCDMEPLMSTENINPVYILKDTAPNKFYIRYHVDNGNNSNNNVDKSGVAKFVADN